MKSGSSAIVIGDINNDIILNIDQHPIEGDESIVSRSSIRVGGSACNTAILLARLAINTVLFGNVANDPMGQMALSAISKSGADCSRINMAESSSTGFITVTVTPGGQRTMYSFRGCNVAPFDRKVFENDLYNAQLVHISGYTLLDDSQYNSILEIIHTAKVLKKTICFDPGLQALISVPSRFFQILPDIDLLLISEREIQVLFPENQIFESIQSMQFLGANTITLKRGRKGSTCFNKSAQHFAPVPHLENVLDTTGAGDAFNSGYILGVLHHLPYSDCLSLGNIVAQLVISSEGGIPSFIENDLQSNIIRRIGQFSGDFEEISLKRLLSVF